MYFSLLHNSHPSSFSLVMAGGAVTCANVELAWLAVEMVELALWVLVEVPRTLGCSSFHVLGSPCVVMSVVLARQLGVCVPGWLLVLVDVGCRGLGPVLLASHALLACHCCRSPRV